MLGKPVPDNRPLGRRMLSPRPAVWSGRGRIFYGLIVLAMFAAMWWLPEPFGIVALVALLPAAFLVMAADERRRAAHSAEKHDE
jgi:hypothetical protein